MSRLYMISLFFFFNDTATTEIYTLSLHDALPVGAAPGRWLHQVYRRRGRVSGQRGREVGDLGLAGPPDAMNDGGECLIGAFVMVTEGLAIDRDAGERARRRVLECFGQAIGVGGERAEGDVVRQHAVVHEDRDRPAAAQLDARRQTVRGRLGDLMRREHGELDSLS